jgi:hypothetical protein
MPGNSFLGPLRAAAMTAVLAGAAGSLGLTLFVGRHNSSRILLLLFAIWVLSPFAGLALANSVFTRWPDLSRTTLYCLMLLIALGSLAIYADVALGPPRAKPAFAFLVVPLASWLLSAISLVIAAIASGRIARRAD